MNRSFCISHTVLNVAAVAATIKPCVEGEWLLTRVEFDLTTTVAVSSRFVWLEIVDGSRTLMRFGMRATLPASQTVRMVWGIGLIGASLPLDGGTTTAQNAPLAADLWLNSSWSVAIKTFGTQAGDTLADLRIFGEFR